jgi:hypothetical protein
MALHIVDLGLGQYGRRGLRIRRSDVCDAVAHHHRMAHRDACHEHFTAADGDLGGSVPIPFVSRTGGGRSWRWQPIPVIALSLAGSCAIAGTKSKKLSAQRRLSVPIVLALTGRQATSVEFQLRCLALQRQRSYVRIVSGAPLRYKTANATSRRFYACGGDKCPEQFGFRAEDADFARIDDLDALRERTQMVPSIRSIFVPQLASSSEREPAQTVRRDQSMGQARRFRIGQEPPL